MTHESSDARSMFHLLPQCRAAYSNGENVTQLLRELAGAARNEESIIEIAYDLQAGTYCDAARSDLGRWRSYGSAIAEHLSPYLEGATTLLDCGTGELTTLVGVLDSVSHDLEVLAFDISLSRLLVGREFADEMLGDAHQISCFTATLGAIPLPDRCDRCRDNGPRAGTEWRARGPTHLGTPARHQEDPGHVRAALRTGIFRGQGADEGAWLRDRPRGCDIASRRKAPLGDPIRAADESTQPDLRHGG